MTTRNYSRFIPGEEIAAVEQWSFDAVDTASLLLAAQVKARERANDQAHDEEIKQQAYAQGFAQGHAQSTLEAQKQIKDFIANQGQEAANKFAELFASAQAQIAASEQIIAAGVLELSCELARQVLRRELLIDPQVLQPVIREALTLLIDENKSVRIRLNPLDLEPIEALLSAEFAALSLSVTADPTVTPGGCLVESAGTVIDGTLEKRWTRAIASLGLDSAWETAHDKQ